MFSMKPDITAHSTLNIASTDQFASYLNSNIFFAACALKETNIQMDRNYQQMLHDYLKMQRK